MEKLIIKYDGLHFPRAMCTIDRLGGADDCDTCEDMCNDCHMYCKKCPIQQAFERLAEYEATGITPDQMLKLDEMYRDRLKEIEELKRAAGSKWIPCSEQLPEEKINPVTNDFYEYQVTFKSDEVTDIRYYKFGRGHWWNGPGTMDKYVTAWQPLPQPYRPEEREK